MIPKHQREEIISLVHREVVPAIGCTEPVAVALGVARATELLGTVPEELHLRLSGNIIKNAMGVGIPGTGMIGLPVAVALGALIGRSEYALEVLRDVNPESVELAKAYMSEGRIDITVAEDAPSNLYIDVTAVADGHISHAIISEAHTNFVLLERDGEVLEDRRQPTETTGTGTTHDDDITLSLAMVYEFATETPLEEIDFILEARDLNKSAAMLALSQDYGHSLGSTISRCGKTLFGDSPVVHMISYTSAACDARMGGAPVPVMSNSGSGNQGITATMPVVSFAEDINASEEQLARA
ncbi:MAG: L-serine ammonia-lyase, iron-sulfur-dependent, subunit alpha, partial [Muribaculaceae bacterium]|nr:L-serine ammonia-lyase, iron-sulfur-dependent, subunit alpha [Muribaculaceae bacterium]